MNISPDNLVFFKDEFKDQYLEKWYTGNPIDNVIYTKYDNGRLRACFSKLQSGYKCVEYYPTDGPWYTLGGLLKILIFDKDKKRHGLQSEWDKDGTKVSEIEYFHGKQLKWNKNYK